MKDKLGPLQGLILRGQERVGGGGHSLSRGGQGWGRAAPRRKFGMEKSDLSTKGSTMILRRGVPLPSTCNRSPLLGMHAVWWAMDF